MLAGCGGGGGGATPSISGSGTGGSAGSDGATIGSISNTLSAVSTTPVKLEGTTPPADVDIHEVNSLQSAGLTTAVSTEAASMSGNVKLHMLRGNAASTPASARRAKGSAVNSPWDVSYFGGYVLSGAQSNDVFVSVPPNNNCDASCRSANNVHPGTMLHDLYHDQFIDLTEQYLSSPGELVVPGGKFALGQSVDVSYTPGPSPAGFTNPVLQENDILNILVEGITTVGATGNPNLVHIFNILLPSGVDTCFSGNQQCWSPDNTSTFSFCAYHAAAQDNAGNVYLFTVIPWVSLNYCSASATGINFPNQVSQGNDPADAIYGVLSHETFETISDPLPGSGWFNYANGDEIGDECPGFENFVNLNGDHYYIQSEYSDVGHECISANLTPGHSPQTP